MRTLLLDVRLGDDLGGKVEPFAEVVEALRREGVVVPLPAELGLEVAAGGEGLASLDHLWTSVSEGNTFVGPQDDIRRGSWYRSRCAWAG